MIEISFQFIFSQILMFFAMGLDFLSLQFKERRHIYLIFAFSAALISIHYFLLGRITAGIIVFFSVLRFITCIFTTNKKYLILFLILNTLALIFTYSSALDILIYIGLFIFIVGNFQKNDRLMRKQMMVGAFLVMTYNLLIFSPIGAVAGSSFLLGNFIGYYRHYIKKSNLKDSLLVST